MSYSITPTLRKDRINKRTEEFSLVIRVTIDRKHAYCTIDKIKKGDWNSEKLEVRMARDLFTLQFVEGALENIFPYQKDEIMIDFVKMLLFDALVGNNDRHFYNWGVIRSLDGNETPFFSPIYDSARGLFWNEKETKIIEIVNDKDRLDLFIKKYTKASKPKIGWEGESNINHFKLVEKIFKEEFYISKEAQIELFLQSTFAKMIDTVTNKFNRYLGNERIFLITKCLEYRYNTIIEIIKSC